MGVRAGCVEGVVVIGGGFLAGFDAEAAFATGVERLRAAVGTGRGFGGRILPVV